MPNIVQLPDILSYTVKYLTLVSLTKYRKTTYLPTYDKPLDNQLPDILSNSQISTPSFFVKLSSDIWQIYVKSSYRISCLFLVSLPNYLEKSRAGFPDMVLILDGNSEIGAHVSDLCSLGCISSNLTFSPLIGLFSFMRAQQVLSYHLI